MKLWLKIPLVVLLALAFIWLGSWWSDHHTGVDEAIDYGCQIVIVSKVDIPPNTGLDPLIAAKEFGPKCVPQDALVMGAITDLKQLENRTTTATIYAGEQIPVMRLNGSSDGPL